MTIVKKGKIRITKEFGLILKQLRDTLLFLLTLQTKLTFKI